MHITEPLPTDKGARLVFGLDWRAYPVKGAKAERRRYADDFGATHYVEFKVGQESIGGFAAPDPTETRGAKLFSGAARIALHERIKSRPAALVLLQDEQRIHLVYVVRGAVRSDEVLSPETAHERRVEIEQECLRLNLALTTLGAGASIGDVDEAFPASALLADRKAGRISKLPVTIPTIVPVALIGIALIVVGNKAIHAFDPPPPPPRHEPTYQEKYAAALKQTFSTPHPLASELGPLLLDQFGRNESVMDGWVFEYAECGATGSCADTYRRAGGTFAGFDHAAPESMRPLKFDADGLHLRTRGHAVPAVHLVTASDSKSWLSEQALIDTLQTPPQRLSVKPYELASHGYVVNLQPSKLLLLAPARPNATRAPLIRQGEWQIDGYRWQASLLARLPPNMSIDTFKVELKTRGEVGVHFTAKGKYYVLE
ncbi:hypothetical protein [Paraburkholderia gardini]|uniref:hypothetical protein n=1 Tax=Paraburkholderia gardini TaxID=2823469 RepID=UPI001E37259C|nr:hypothetical protein [Paraburkholderia gardini]